MSAKIRLEVGMMVLSLSSKLTSHLLCAGQAQAAGAPADTKTQSLRLSPPGRRDKDISRQFQHGLCDKTGHAVGTGEGSAPEVPDPAPSGLHTYQEAFDFLH